MSFDMTRIQMLVDKVQEFLGGWLEQKLKAIHPNGYWQSAVLAALDERQRKIVKEDGSSCPQELDLPMQVSVFRYNWPSLLETFHLNRQLYNDAVAVKQIRNKYGHKKRNNRIDVERYHHDIETVYLFLKELNAPDEVLDGTRSILQETGSAMLIENKDKSTVKISVNALPLVPMSNRREDTATNLGKEHSQVLQANITPTKKSHANTRTDMKTDWIDVAKLLREDINASLTLDFGNYQFGECLLLRNGDSAPIGVELSEGWQSAVALHIKNGDRKKIMQKVSSFNKASVMPNLSGEYAVWQFPQPIGHKVISAHEPTTEVFLPKWLPDYIYVERGLRYLPDCESVQYNLGASKEFSYQYLATYFPRTFAEIVSIFDYVFLNNQALMTKLGEKVSILDVGCGSGAAALGIMWSLKKTRIARVKKVEVLGLDGNQNYLDRFREMADVFKRNWKTVGIDVMAEKTTNIESTLSGLPKDQQFDFVVSSKFIQEMRGLNAYATISQLCRNRLKSPGILVLLENYREGRTESNCLAASQSQQVQVETSAKTEFSIKQIPGCECVKEQVGYQILIKQSKEAR